MGHAPHQKPPHRPCPRCGRIHIHWPDCTQDALALFSARMTLEAKWADGAEKAAIQRYDWQHRQ
jgi:hypothetical protein